MAEIERITGYTHLISLIGSPVAHSSSPATHNLSFSKLGVDSAYITLETTQETLEGAINAMRTLGGWDGSNVTMPCKQAVIPYLDELDPAAELMNAVNVVSKKDGKLKGYNTDGMGFWSNMEKHGVDVKGATVTLVGIGGAGSAVLTQGALNGAAAIHAFNIQDAAFESAKALAPRVAEKTGCDVQLHDLANTTELQACIDASAIVINATNVGMGEGKDVSAVPIDMLKPEHIVADTVYFPRETYLIRQAAAKGCKTVTGLGMMLEQAAAGEKIWYGVDMPVDEIAQELFA